MKPGGARNRRDSLGKVQKTAYVRSAKPTTNRRRAATFVRTEDVSGGTVKALKGTLNPVTRTKLKSGGGRPMVGTDGTVFFKRRSDDAPAQYAVASTRLARFLGMPDVIAHNAFARIKDVEGAVSGRVPGKPLVSFEYKTPRNFGPGYSTSDMADLAKAEGLIKRGNTYYKRSAAVHQWVDYADPRIQKGLSDLQLFDAISGQVDRHAGNIYIDPDTGAVTGIDDDRAFGQGQNARDVAGQMKSQHYRGLPELVDAATADEILEKDPDDLREELSRRDNDLSALTDAEIDDAVLRLETVQDYLRDLKARGELVTVWNDDTYRQQGHSSDGSYLGRQVEILADAFTGRLAEKGTHKEHRLRVTGAPMGVVPTVPAPPQPLPTPPPAPTRVRRDLLGAARAQAPRAVTQQQDVQRPRPLLGAARTEAAQLRASQPETGSTPPSDDDSADGFTDADGRITLSEGDQLFLDDDAGTLDSDVGGATDRLDEEQERSQDDDVDDE